MTDCVFKEFCKKVYDYDCKEKYPSWQACDNYWFAVLVRNNAIENVMDEAFAVDELGNFCIPTHDLKALKMQESP